MSTSIALDLGEGVHIAPPQWPNDTLRLKPGDLSQFAPQGNGVYGYQGSLGKLALQYAPEQEEAGGIVYFGNGIAKPDLDALFRIMNVPGDDKDLAAYVAEAKHPGTEAYIAQLRVVHKFALRHMFNALTDDQYERFPRQELNIGDVIYRFIEAERKRWGTGFGAPGLAGMFGGDGDWAQEELSFGFMVENDYHHVCRIWSRAWLVTK